MDVACGICHEETVYDLGEIDSCCHSFCYPCIAKWAEIESRCPFCKLRFTCITRTAKQVSSTLDFRQPEKVENIVSGSVVSRHLVPQRDQRAVFEDPNFVEWLEGLSCIICSGSEHEDRLLLCDGCDQACHTYCLGLSSVPEGSWFCGQCLQAQTRQRRSHTEENRQSNRTRRSYRILESEDDQEIIQEPEGEILSSPETEGALLAQPDGAVRRSTRLEMLNSARNRRRRERNAQRIEAFQSQQDGSMSFDDVLCISTEEGTSLNPEYSIPAEDNKDPLGYNRKNVEIDLTSPTIVGSRQLVSIGEPSYHDRIAAGHLTPPLLNLRSRLQSSLFESERFTVSNSSPNDRHMLSGFRTAGDLTFGANVAAGRTPASSGQKSYSNAIKNSNELFAYKTQAVLQAMMPSASVSTKATSGISPLPLRERLENHYNGLDSKTNSAIKSLEYLKNLEGSESSKMQKHHAMSCFEMRARALVEQQLSLLFEPGELSEKAWNDVTSSAVNLLIEKCDVGENLEDKAGEAVDKALITLEF